MKALIVTLLTVFSLSTFATDPYQTFPGVKMSNANLMVFSFTEFPDLAMVRATVIISGADAKRLYDELGTVLGTKADEEIVNGTTERSLHEKTLTCRKKSKEYGCSVFVGF